MEFIKRFKGKLMLLFVALAWGSTMVVIKGATDFIPPGFLLACRFTRNHHRTLPVPCILHTDNRSYA